MPENKNKSDDKKKVEADHAKTSKPLSPTEDPQKHDVPASALTAQIDPKGTGGATVNAASIDTLNADDKAKEDQKKLEEDQSIAGKIRRSGLYFVRDHTIGRDYVGISPQNDPNATEGSKRLSSVQSLDGVSPRTGMQIVTKDGVSFSVGDGYGPEKTPADWASISKPDGSPLFA